jgi:signal transduction histidine kinase
MAQYTILIADDQPKNIQIIANALGETDIPHKTIRAINGKILCELAEKRLPDLIITDWQMPEMDGIEAIKHLKKNKSTQNIPIIICTGIMTTSEDLRIALDSGAVDFLRKPIDAIELQARVNSMLKLSDSYNVIIEQKNSLELRKTELQKTNKELEETLKSLIETQTKLIQSEKMASIGVLASGIAHEINNPLNYIQGGITSLEEYFEENLHEHISNVEPFVTAINHGIDRSIEIVSSLSHYSQNGDYISEEMDIHIIIDNCLLLLQNKTRDKIMTLKKYSPQKFFMSGNEGKLHQAILNVLTNAVQAISDEGVITIETQVYTEILKIMITDTGCGIKEEDLPKILDPFYTTKGPDKGKGLGLSIANNFIQDHKGNIDFESSLGKGTTATIILPLGNS